MCWTPLSNTTQYVLDTTIKHNTICAGHHYKTQQNICWTPLLNTTQYVLDTTIKHNTICAVLLWCPAHIVLLFIVVSSTYCVVFNSGVQHILCCV
jgi:hypothetical protein